MATSLKTGSRRSRTANPTPNDVRHSRCVSIASVWLR